ncbi:MAG: amidohydrolase family protein [Myxococcota bacterium]
MSYAGDRRILDADSHLMELPDFLSAHASPGVAEALPSVVEIGAMAGIAGVEVESQAGRHGHPPETVEALVAHGDRLLRGPKWYEALGAFNGAERGRALDLLGFERQLVFSSITAGTLFGMSESATVRAGLDAHNRAMADFCSADSRLVGVGAVVLDDVAHALASIDAALTLGLGAIWIPARAPGGRSPGHPAHDPIWARLEEARVPFVLHVGSAPLSIAPEWLNDGHPERRSARGGPEVIGSRDLCVIYQPAERFLSVLVLDGVLERFPGLRGGCMELGAGWVPAMIRRLDHAVAIWGRSEPHLAAMPRRPSEQVGAQLRFTPYPFEDVGRLIGESDERLYLFSSDYPHREGGHDPLSRFERSLEGHAESTKRRFYADNLADLICP